MTTLLNNRYRIVRALGEGGFGETFLAEDTHMPSRRRCVIKQLKPQPSMAQLIKQRFAREAAVLEQVGKGHAQVPDLYAYFEAGERFYLVQEWIEGESVSELVSRSPSNWTAVQVVDLLGDLLPVLVHIHAQGIIHRDIKPENIIVRQADQLPCLIDFGAVKELMGTAMAPDGTEKSSIIIGTPGYMSPEQLAGRPTFASDLFSLGMSALELLSGQAPSTLSQADRQRLLQTIASQGEPIAQILTRATEPYPQNRYATATEMLAALTALKHPPTELSEPVSARFASTVAPSFQAPTVMDNRVNPERFSVADSLGQKSWSQKRSLTIFGLVAVSLLIGLFLGLKNPEAPVSSSQQNSPVSSGQPASADEYTQRATDLYADGREVEALENLDTALAIDPNSLAALTLKGDIFVNQSRPDYAAAVELYTQVLALEANNLSVLSKRCDAYSDLQEWALAAADCTQGIQLDPEAVDLYSKRGDILAAQADFEGAIADYSQAIELNKASGTPEKNRHFYFRRYKLREKVGDIEGALADLNKTRNPSAPE
jgi:serine/threonine protein kinase